MRESHGQGQDIPNILLPVLRYGRAAVLGLGVEVEKIDVTHDPDERKRLVQVTGQRTVPQIFIGDESIGGYSDAYALHQRGELEPKLA